MALDNAAAQNEAFRILNNNDQSQLLEEKLKRLVDLANLHDGDREQRDDVFTSLPEGASNNRQNYEQQAPSGNSSLPDASLDRPWISSALPEQQNPTLTSEGVPHNPERSGSIGSDSDLGTQDFQTPFAVDSQIDGPAVLGAERPGGGEGNVPFPGPSGRQTPDHNTPGGSPKSNHDPHSPGETPKPGPGPSPDRATITVAGAPKDLTVDETDLTTDATANFGAYFSATYGVNGKGIGGMTFKIGVVQPGTDSGLVDEATGQHLLLFHNSDGSISGRTPGGLEGFHITTDQVGNIELDQLRSIVHPDPNNTDESITLKNPNLITITGTAVSAGGDSASATIGIGQVFHFKDDAPSLQLTTNGHPPVLGVDETFIGQAGGTSTQSFASLFSGSHQFGADGSGTFKTSYELNLSKDGVFSGLIDSETGERILLHVNTQNGNITGILEKTGKEALKISTTQAGDITFTSERAVIHPDPTNTDEEIHLSPGLLALRRTDTITDKDGDSATSSAQIDLGSSLTIHDDAPSITPPATTGTIPDFVVTEQGGINGAASHNFSSNFSTGNSNAVDQNASLTTAFSFSLNHNGVDSGLQDHNGNHIFLFQSGDNVVGLVGNSNSPNPNGSNALQITLDPTSGQATFSSSQDLQHSDPSKSGTGDQLSFNNNVLSITRTDTITDADGDHASASNSLDISGAFLINDTAPSITPPATTGTIPDFVVTEQGGINGAASHNFSSNFSTGNSNAVDQNASLTTAFSFSLNHNGVDSGLQDHNGNHIFLFQSGDNVVGLVGNSNSPNPNGSNALQITLDPTSGQATFSSSQDLQHSDPSKSGTGDQLSFNNNVLSITRTDTITDADGDHASASNSLDISGAFLINDTAPSITPPATTGTIPDFVVTEQGGINGAASHNFSSNFSTGNSNAVDQNASLTTAFSFSLNHNGVDSGLQDHNGNHIFLFQSGDNVVGLVGNSNSPNPNGSNALQITLDPTSGQATFSSSQDLQHSDPSKSGTGDQLSFNNNVLSITRTDTITDADGDHASASNSLDISGAFLINDTAPSITPPATTGTIPDFVVTEQGGINGAASHNFSSNFSTGNSNAVDQNASLTTAFSFSLNHNGVDSGLQDHNGNHIFLFQSGDNVVGLVGNSNSPNPNGSNALQITLDPTSGQATFSSSQDLQHSDPSKSGTGDQLSFNNNVLSITRTDTITDADGDHASASNSLDISGAFLINDTAPSITPPATTGTIPDFVVTEQGGINGAASHNFSSNFSTGNSNAVDQNASLTTAFSFSLNHNGVDSGLQDHNGNHIFLFQSGDNVVGLVGNSNSPNPNGSNALQITLDPTSGQATFSSSQDLQHSDPSKSGTGDQLSFNNNVLSITRTDTITDADGDHASASNSLDISGAFLINDTAPSITPPATTGTIPDFVVTEQGGINGAASHNFSSNFSTGNSNAVDQNASLTTAFSFSLNHNGVDSGLQDHNGNHIFLFQSGDNVVGLVGNSNSPNPNGSNALQITLDPTSGQATFSSSQDLQHSDPSKSGTGDQLSFNNNVLSITRTDTITDADGDHASASNSLDISGAFLINDTAPSITPPATTGTIPDFVVTEQGGINGAASHNFSSNFSTGNSNAVDQNASLTTAFSFSLNHNGVDSGLQDHNGNHIFLFQSGDNVVGLVGNSNSPNPNGSNALQITLDPTSGQATFSSSQDLQHSDPSKSGTGDQLSFNNNVLSITRTDTITDADGDHASASNSLDISGAFLINDTAPSITPPATTGTIPDFVVTEQGGINGAASHNFSSNFSTGNSNAVDQNASLTTAFSFSLNHNGVDSGLQDHNGNHIFLFQSGDNVVGLVGNSNSPNPNGSNALQITLDPTSGQATFSSSQDLQHSDPSKSGTGDQLSFNNNVLSITRTDTITDADGDHASASNSLDISGAFLINDTAPSITPPATTGTIPDFVVTEQGGINGAASHNFSSNFSTGNSNAVDQNASLTTAFSFSLNHNGVDSGLQDHNGNHIFLFQSGDNVVGLVGNSNSPNPNGSNALQITLDPTSGQATFSSSQDLQHSDPSKSGTGDQLSFNNNVLSITRTDTITDADGDHASASNSLDISGAFLINDTAPSITPPATTGTIPDFVVTEQGGINGAASHNFSSNFSTGNSNAVDQNASLTTAFSFSLNHNGVDSGLQDHNGNHIFLFQSGDNVVGLVGNSNSPNPNGSNALQITLDPTSGQATFSSSQDLQHSDPSKSGTGDQLSFNNNVLSITRTDTITDADGDHASASNSLDISGAFLINDTAPSITPPATTGTIPDFVVTEQGGINGAASHNFSSNFSTGNSNAVDQNASLTTAFSFSLNHNGVDSGLQDHNGNHIFLFQSGDNVVGLVGNSNSPNPNGSNALQITLDPTSGQATFSSSQDLQHSDPSKSGTGDQLSFNNNVLSITRTDTITDADGDHASASNSLDISGAFLINDTAPSITPPATTGTIPDFVVTEQGGINGAASHNFSSNFSTGNSNAVDQNASLTTAFSFSLNHNGVDSGLQDHNGNHIFLFQSGDNVVGLVGNSNSPNPNGSNALQITLDPTSGQATFSSSQDLQHSDPSKSGTGDQLSFNNNVLSITRTDTITDADGDHASASNSLDISGAFLINDTAPSITPPATTGTIPDFVVTEQGGINGAASHNFSSNFSTGNSNAVDQNASLTTAFSFSLNHNGVDSGLQDHNGNHIFLFQSGDNVVGLVGNSNSPNPNGSNALQITLDPTSGQATFSSSQDLQHSDPSKSGTGDQLSFNNNVLSITRTDTITDADGDHASASNSLDISGAFLINDTAPSITPPATTGTIPDFVVTEQGGINGAASHNFSSNFSTGNSNAVDQNASLTTAFSFSLNHNGVDSGLQDHNGNHIFLFQSGDNVVGLVGNSNSPNPNGSNALQITLDPTSGQATFSSSQDLQHSDPSKSGTGDQLSFNNNVLSITRTDTITDADGDHASASNSLDISGAFLINDTAPSITPPATTGTIPDFVVTEQGGINGAASHNFSSNFSTGNSNAVDQNASLTTAFSFSLNHNGVDSGLQDHNGNHIFLFQSGDNVVGLVGNSNSPNPNGSNALQITLDPTSGQATFSSSQDLQHSDPSKSGTGDQLSFNNNVLSITRTDTITDADGDHASASNSLDISGAFLINDTAPSITPPATTGTIPDFVVTEQGGINGAASHNFSSNFSTGNSNAVDQNASLTTAFSFSLNHNGVDSGLQDHNGNHIFLFQSGDNVVGLVGNSNSPNPNGSNALQITLDPTSGQATFSSSQDLQHSDPSKSGTGDQLSFNNNVLSITRTDTITDADGDHASASNSLDISGAFLINDTAPSITPPATTGTIPDFVVTEQGGINGAASHNFSSNFSTGNSNAVDQNASLTTAFSFSLNHNGVDSGLQDHNGNHIFLFQSGDNVVGLVGNSNSPNPNGSNALQITLDPTSGQATFSSSQDLQHSDPSKSGTGDQLSFNNNVLSITRTDTITDADGDHASASNSLDISGAFLINDTAPSITPPATTGTIPDFVVTEQGGINGAASHNFSSNFSTGNSNAVDQNASLTTAFSFSLNHNGVDSGLQDHNGNHIFLFQSGDNVVGLVGNSNSPNPNGSNALQITLDPTSGQATFSSSQDLQHSDPSKSGTGDQLSFNNNVLSITRTDTITDADGDHASASNSLDISGAFLINDTAPSITPPATTGTIPDFVVTEQGGINGAASHNFSSNFSTGNSNAVDQNASLTTAFSFSLNHNGVDSGLQDHNGNHIFLFQSGDNVVGLVGNSNSPNPNGSNALQITLDPTSGQATFSSSQDLQHSDPSKSGTGDQLSFNNNVLSITRTDTITDADGDHASASNSLDISGAFLINDTAPSITPPATTGTIPDFVVTEQGGINGAASHNFSSNFSTGNSNAVDQNASLTTAFSFSLNHNGVDSGLQDHNGNHIFLFQSGDNVVGLVGNSNSPNPNGSNALQITLDPTSGQATFSSSQDLQHSDPSKSGTGDQLSFNNNVLSITRTDTITDADGDHASASNSLDISGAFLINDTAPSITPPATTGTIPDFVVTEQGGINGAASHNFSSNFSTGNSNAVDQNASLTTAFSFSLNHNGVDSGLQDHNGNHIFLFQSGDNVVGLVGNSNSPNPNGSNALQITLDPTSGQATFSSSQDLQHSDPSKSGTGDQLSFNNNVLSITRTDTITDADGDHASASNSLDISGAFLINDTAPSITPPATTGTIPDFVVTEQGGINGAASHNFSSNFSTGNSNAVDQNASLTTAFSFSLNHNGVDSGLQDHNGNHIFLFQSGDNVVGLVGNSNSPNPNGSNALQITLDPTSGQATFSSSQDLQHSDPSKSGTGDQLSFNNNVLSITRTDTITDADGDHASASNSLDISGAFLINDTAPSVDPSKVGTLSPLVTDDDTLNVNAATSLSSLFSSAFTPGADGTQSIAYSLDLSAQDANSGLHALNPSGGPIQGPEILLHRDSNGVIHGYPSGGKSDGSEDLFTITIDGKNNLVLDQIKPIWQDNTSSNNEQTLLTALPNTLKITASITDQDGDSASTSIDASSCIFAFQDSGPSVDPSKVGTLSPLVTDDDTLNVNAATSLSSLFSSAFTPGADGTQSIAYSLDLSAQDANSGLHALNPSGGPIQGPEILLHRDSNGVIHGYPSGGKSDGSEDLFTITIDGKNNLVLDQIKPIWQDNTSSNNEQTLLTALPNTLKITASITDQDGDSASTSIDASSGIFAFQDSGPSVDPSKVGTLSPLVTDDDTLNVNAATSLSSLFSSAFTPGADGTQSIAYSLDLSAQDANSGLHALNPSGGPIQGPEILLHRDSNGVIHGYPSGGKSDGSEDLFTITIDGKNNLVLDQIKPIWQDNTSSNNEQTLLTALPNTLKITASITDQDGDSASTSIDASSGIFAFQDSGPSVDPSKVGTLSPLVTDDDTLNVNAATSLSSLFSSAFTPGADGTQSIAYSLDLSAQDANSGLHALNPSGGPIQGPEILLHRDSNGVIHGYPSGGKSDGSEDLFTITIDGKNNLVLDQIKPIWQDNTSSNNEQTLLTALPNTLKITASITDQDGDSASTSIDASSGIFAFQDSGPSVDPSKVGTLSPLVTDDDTLNVNAATSLSSLFSSAFTPGADGTQSIAYSLDLSAQDANSGLHALNPSGGPIQGPEILLHRDSNGVIHGYPSGGKSDGSEDLFTITIDGKNNLVLDQIKPIWQDNTSSNNEQTLLTALPNTLKITASITDQDGDSASTSIDASSGIFAFQDSGPSVDPSKVGTLSPLVTDDDTLNVNAATSLSSLFSSAFTPGADGTQSIAYSLDLSAQDANSGLHALNPSGGPIQGPEILLHRDSNGVIHGYPSGGKSDGSEDLFTITIDGKNNLVLDQIKPIWQDNTSSNNEQTLLTALPNTLKITASITDQDGDSASTSIDASSGIFAFQDSGPSISMGNASVSTTQHPQTSTPPSTGTTTITTTTIFDAHQNIGLVLDYSGSMGWSNGHQDPDNANTHSKIHQQLLASAHLIKQAFENAGYKVTTSQNGLTDLNDWKLEPLAGHTPGNVHLGAAIFGASAQTQSVTIDDTNYGRPHILASINNLLHNVKISGTNHTEAWKAAQNITTSWQQSNISDQHHTPSGAEIKTDTNMVIMTDGETSKGQDMISSNSYVLTTYNEGQHQYGLNNISGWNSRNKATSELKITYTDSAGIQHEQKLTRAQIDGMINDHNNPLGTRGHGYSNSHAVRDNNGDIIGWLGFPKVIDPNINHPHHHHPNPIEANPLVFTPNEASGITITSIENNKSSGPNNEITPIMSSGFNSQGAQLSHNLDQALKTLDQQVGHETPNVIGVGIVDRTNNSIGSQLQSLFKGSLPDGSSFEQVNSHDTLDGSLSQQIQHAVQQSFQNVDVHLDFNFDPGSDDDLAATSLQNNGVVEFTLEQKSTLLGTGGHSPVQAFAATFGGNQNTSNVKDLGNGEFEIKINGLGTFTINTGNTVLSSGSHNGTIDFKADPGVSIGRNLDLTLSIKDADGDTKSVNFTLPKFNTNVTPSQTQHDEPDQNGFTADISVIANDALASAQADSDTEATLAALISLGLKTDHDDVDLSQSTQDDGSQLITRTIHTDQGDILETITDPQNGNAPSLQLDVSGLDADTQKDLQATIQAQTSSSASESKPGQLDSVLSDATQSPPAIDGHSLADAISDLQQLDADAIAALNGQDTSTNSADESSLSGDAALTPLPQDPSDVPVTSMEDAFASPQQTDDDVMAPPDLSDTSQTAAPLPDNSTQDQDLSLLNT